MPLTPYACAHCGFWQRYFAVPPDCPVCTDVRNDLPEDGWDFVRDDAAAARLQTAWRDVAPGIVEFRVRPGFGLDGRGWLLLRDDGNVAFEAAPYYDEASLARIAGYGGIAWLSTSHPHGTGALWQLQDRFEPRVPLHRDGIVWSKAFRVTDPYDDGFDIAPDLRLLHIGGHYEGQAVLHDARRRALFCGDALKLEFDEGGATRGLSAHKAFHKHVPLTHGELERYRQVFARCEFDRVYTPFDDGDVTTAEALAFFDAQLAGRPSTRPQMLR